jgi:hypothetical protein
MEQHAVTVAHAAFSQCRGGGLDPVAKRLPGPGGFTPNDRGPFGKTPSGLDQKGGEVSGGDQRSGSRIET